MTLHRSLRSVRLKGVDFIYKCNLSSTTAVGNFQDIHIALRHVHSKVRGADSAVPANHEGWS